MLFRSQRNCLKRLCFVAFCPRLAAPSPQSHFRPLDRQGYREDVRIAWAAVEVALMRLPAPHLNYRHQGRVAQEPETVWATTKLEQSDPILVIG